MADKLDDARARADAKFKKAERLSGEAEQARADHAAKARSVDANTARLKALRLAKEADEKAAAAAPPASPSGGHARRGRRKRSSPPLVANPDEVKGG